MKEWILFWITAVLTVAAMALMTAGVIGNIRFGNAANRIHAAGIGDTLGMLLVTAGMAVSAADAAVFFKLFLPLIFLWVTSPVSSHFLCMMEYRNGLMACPKTVKN